MFAESIAGDSWVALYHETKPFDSDDIRSEQILENLQRLNYTAKGMFVEVSFCIDINDLTIFVAENVRGLGFAQSTTARYICIISRIYIAC